MLLSTPFNAVTKLSIDVCAAEVSGLMVNVVGVTVAGVVARRRCNKLRVTPVMALLTTIAGAGRRKTVDREIRILGRH